jgi:hypothetical protein
MCAAALVHMSAQFIGASFPAPIFQDTPLHQDFDFLSQRGFVHNQDTAAHHNASID